MVNYLKAMYAMTQRSADLSVVSDSISLSDDSITELDFSSRTIRTYDEDNEAPETPKTPEQQPTPERTPSPPDSRKSTTSSVMFEEDSELMPLCPNLMYQTVDQRLAKELEDIGKSYNFICIDRTMTYERLYQFKSRGIKQTITLYLKTGTVRLQPGGPYFQK